MSAEPRRFLRDTRGTTAAEFAVVLPVLIVMLTAGIQFGWAQHSSGSLGFALEKVARRLVLDPTLDQAAVQALVANQLDAATAAKVTVSLTKATGAGGAQIATITGVYTDQVGIPSLAALPFQTTRVVVTPLPET